jgi:predicted transcriptional regulator
MSEPASRGSVKTLAIRLPDELHAQLVLIASLEDQSLTDTIRQAIAELIERKRGNGDLAAQAAKALEEMEQEAQTRRQALQALLGTGGETPGQQPPAEEATPSRGRSRRNDPAS